MTSSEHEGRLRRFAKERLPESVVHRIRGGEDPAVGEARTLRARVRALEAEVQENRQLNRRIAELTDLVVELLVPLEARDTARVEEVLEKYRQGL